MFMPQKKRRGRKRKIDKLLEAAQAVAAEKMAQAQLAAVESAMAKQSTGKNGKVLGWLHWDAHDSMLDNIT